MKRRMTAFCIACDEEVEYTVFAERVETVIRGVKISYVEVAAKCPVCGEEIYVPEINDANVQAREKIDAAPTVIAAERKDDELSC